MLPFFTFSPVSDMHPLFFSLSNRRFFENSRCSVGFCAFLIFGMLPSSSFAQGTTIPAKIEAENWSSFHVRADQPQTAICSDVSGGRNICGIQPGDWLAYDLFVEKSGDYQIHLRVATGAEGTQLFHLELDGVDCSGPMLFSKSKDWQDWHTVTLKRLVTLSPGKHQIKVVFESGNLSLNWLDVSLERVKQSLPPAGFTLKSADLTSAHFTWADTSSDDTAYELYLSTDGRPSDSPALRLDPGTTSAKLTGLESGRRYQARLLGLNSEGKGRASSVFFTTLTKEAPPAIAVGELGSIAAYPPYDEGAEPGLFQNYALNTQFNLAPGDTRPVPTNDWWTHLLFNDSNAFLWAYPQMVRVEKNGYWVHYPNEFTESGNAIVEGAFIQVGGIDFAPQETIVKDWSDWGLVVRLQDGEQAIDATLGHGIPFTYFETEGMKPKITFSLPVTFLDATQEEVRFPVKTNQLLITLGEKHFGLHFPDDTTIDGDQAGLEIDSNFFSISVLPDAAALESFHANALNIPRSTEVHWDLDPENSMLQSKWIVKTERPNGDTGGAVLQGFLSHHVKDLLARDFEFTPHTYTTTRGPLILASGNSFHFKYRWHGIVPHYPAPSDTTGAAPWRPEVMHRILTDYAADASYGTDTYWGGKDIVLMGKYMLIARELSHPAYDDLKAMLQEAIADWLIYTPGETERYYADYPAWSALVGFDESFYSYQFNDHHFHYSYLIQAAAYMAMVEPEWIQPYSEILKIIAKEYANWDRNDSDFPFLRNFDPWMGHSYAGGIGSPGGNNQESTSEAIQSWAALFFLGSLLGDEGMRDAGAFGYLSESNATMEYWFNRSGDIWPAAYDEAQDVVGILWNNSYVYGTFFSAAPQHIYGIQWLPLSPALKYFVRNVSRQWSDDLYGGLMQRILQYQKDQETPAANDSGISEADVGTDWGNVLLGYRLFSNPDSVNRKFEAWRDSEIPEEQDIVYSDLGGLTYYYSHAHTSWGEIDWDVQFSMPAATAFRNPQSGVFTFVFFNPEATEQTCEVRRNGKLIGSFPVPSRQTVTRTLDSIQPDK